MGEVRDAIRFVLNNEEVRLSGLAPDRTLLDFLRLEKRLRGTKEGCAEGDCGACTVLVGRIEGGELVYAPVTACITLLAGLDGCHVVSVEHLSQGGEPNPVQRAMVEHHASQCGFCTPGFVMSLTALWMETPRPGRAAVEEALQGNLCRCTGYAPILRAAGAMADYGGPGEGPLAVGKAEMRARLLALRDGRRVETGDAAGRSIVPAGLEDFAVAYAANPEARIVAGATDVGLWVTKFMRPIAPAIFINGIEELCGIEEDAEGVRFGAGVTHRRAAPVLARRFPGMGELMARFAGAQVRAMGTVGGNIANGSPIGDLPPPLIALGARLVLRRGGARREIALEDFFIDYGRQDRRPGEFVESVFVPALPQGERFAVYKVSKRRDEDISALCGAFRVALDGKGVIVSARIAFGGMAGVPRRAARTEAALVGRALTAEGVAGALDALGEDYQPIGDMRASAEYRRLVARNLLVRFAREAGEGARDVRLARAVGA